jgi:hypothetical protein
MDTITTTTNNNNTRSHYANALKLRVVSHQCAAQIAAHARAVERHARKLARVHAKIKAEAVAIAGPDDDKHHIVGFEETASLDEQLRDTATGGEVFGAGLEDVIDVASSMANRAGYVAAFAMPPKLLSENR